MRNDWTCRAALLLIAIAAALVVGCGGAEDPSGGPYGGNASVVVRPGGGDASPSDDASAAEGGGAQPSASGSTLSSGVSEAPGSGSSGGVATMGQSSAGSAPTWTMIYNTYMKAGTVGDCGSSSFCHPTANTPAGAYSYLQSSQGQNGFPAHQLSGSPPKLVQKGQSCLSWYGGDMPIGRAGADNAQAVIDMNAWAAAGARNN